MDQIKETPKKQGIVSGGQTQEQIDERMKQIRDKFPNVFKGIGKAKVEPIHIERDPKCRPVQQKRRPIPIHYKEKLREHLEELKEDGVISGPLGSDCV